MTNYTAIVSITRLTRRIETSIVREINEKYMQRD